MLKSINVKKYEDLEKIASEINEMFGNLTLPDDLVQEMKESYAEMKKTNPAGTVSVRSSALGEDTGLSFAGQYATFLNVGEDELFNKYINVLASKFTPKAIYYFLSHSLDESELAMSVGCISMIDAKASTYDSLPRRLYLPYSHLQKLILIMARTGNM